MIFLYYLGAKVKYLCKPAKKKWFKKVDNWTEKSLPLGTLWAECLQKEFGWVWVNIFLFPMSTLGMHMEV